jgi:hypothetical protein
LGDQIGQSIDLSARFIADQNGLVAPLEQGSPPGVQPTDFLREIGVEVRHEQCQALRASRADQQVVVIGQEHDLMKVDGVQF